MKTVKLLFAAVVMTFAMSASAQIENHFFANVNLGISTPGTLGAWGVGAGYEKGLNNWLAWDIAMVDISSTFKRCGDGLQFGVKTGLRAYTPTFWGDNFRGYANYAGGYTYVKGAKKSSYGMIGGVGLQYKEKFSVGYAFQYETAGKSKIHFLSLGYAF